MKKLLKVQDVMTRDVFTVTPRTHVCEAIQILIDHHFTALPVVDDQRHVLGMVTEEDVVHLMLEELITETEFVEGFMKKDVLLCSPQESIIDVCERLLQNPAVTLPVVENQKLVGIISRFDLLKLILPKREKK